MALKLPVHLVPVRLGTGNPRGWKWWEQRRLQSDVVQPLRQRSRSPAPLLAHSRVIGLHWNR